MYSICSMYGIWRPTFTRTKSQSFVGRYTIHGAHEYMSVYDMILWFFSWTSTHHIHLWPGFPKPKSTWTSWCQRNPRDERSPPTDIAIIKCHTLISTIFSIVNSLISWGFLCTHSIFPSMENVRREDCDGPGSCEWSACGEPQWTWRLLVWRI